MNSDIIVIGGGAAGCMAAISAARTGARVLLLERNLKLGRKLYITGKGRCNLTNDVSAHEVLRNIPTGNRFLTSVVTRFSPEAVKTFFEELGVPLKTERGNRVFPQSDKATDIIDALLLELRRQRVEIIQGRATDIMVENGTVHGVQTEHGEVYRCKAIILATGGVSYPRTGSSGDGHKMAIGLGHTIIPLSPSLVPLEMEGPFCQRMQGLSLRNVILTVKNSRKKVVFQEQGELLFTHFGLSGPLVLSASSHMPDIEKEHYCVSIDLKPALDEQRLDARLLRDFKENSNRDFHNILEGLVPRLMVPVLVECTAIPSNTKVHSLTKSQRRALLEQLKGFRLEVKRARPVEEAIVTSGGVKTAEVDPKTMASKQVPGLFFAGEILDVDAYTGGFNLQIAWSTGKVAGESAARLCIGGMDNEERGH